MKTQRRIVLLMIIFFAGIFTDVNAKAESGKAETIVIKTTIYCDHCKECGSCGGKIEKDLGFNKGIKLVKLDEKAMTITVTFNPKKTTSDEIRKAISKYGYDADDVKADPDAYSKLDECCLKK